MQIREFGVERWMDRYETTCRYNLAETCVESLTVAELLRLAGRNGDLLAELGPLKLTYGAIPGSDRLRGQIASLYAGQAPENILVTHGAIGANALVYQALVERGTGSSPFSPPTSNTIPFPRASGPRSAPSGFGKRTVSCPTSPSSGGWSTAAPGSSPSAIPTTPPGR